MSIFFIQTLVIEWSVLKCVYLCSMDYLRDIFRVSMFVHTSVTLSGKKMNASIFRKRGNRKARKSHQLDLLHDGLNFLLD